LTQIYATGLRSDAKVCGFPRLHRFGQQQHGFGDNTAADATSTVPGAASNGGAARKPIYMPAICHRTARHIEIIRRTA
jgi:hypothetical protein